MNAIAAGIRVLLFATLCFTSKWFLRDAISEAFSLTPRVRRIAVEVGLGVCSF